MEGFDCKHMLDMHTYSKVSGRLPFVTEHEREVLAIYNKLRNFFSLPIAIKYTDIDNTWIHELKH